MTTFPIFRSNKCTLSEHKQTLNIYISKYIPNCKLPQESVRLFLHDSQLRKTFLHLSEEKREHIRYTLWYVIHLVLECDRAPPLIGGAVG